MGLKGFAFRKIIAAVLTIFAILTANFVIFRIAPGDPVRMMFSDPRVSAENIQRMKIKFGLDKSMGGQFISYLKAMAHGDLGMSFWQKRPVAIVIAERIPRTLLLVITALTLAVIIGVFLGALAGWKSGSRLDSIILGLSLTIYSIPTFALGVILLLIFAFHLAILPLGGIMTPAADLKGIAQFYDLLRHMLLPVFSIMLWYVGEYVILTRSSMIDVLDQDYIQTARAKGLSEFKILKDHALRNALLPVITITGVNLGFAVAGVIEAETVFSWPGVGRLIYDAVVRRDYPLLQGVFLLFTISVVMANLAIDLVYGFIDPRIKVKT